MTKRSSPAGSGDLSSPRVSRGEELHSQPTPSPCTGVPAHRHGTEIAARRSTGLGTPGRLASLVLCGFIVVVLGSCDGSTALEIEEFCEATPDVLLASEPAQVVAIFPLEGEVLVVEESTAPGCQPWDWNGDHTACINATLQLAADRGTSLVGLTRGRQYRYSGRIDVLPNTVLGAVGDTTLDRPILATSEMVPDGIAIGSGAEIRNLDIRGPRYNTTNFRVDKHGDWLYKGINGATSSGWSILGTSVNGFNGTGILAARSNDVRIEGSTVSHNGYSGISLFLGDDHCGRRVSIIGNVVEYNGQDGVDACSSEVRFVDNTFRYNGWDRNGGDRHGLLIFVWSEGGAEQIEIVGNRSYRNGESGIRISGNSVSDIEIRGNHLAENGHWGLDPGDPNGTLADVEIQNNSCGPNRLGCLNKAHLSGVAVQANSCFQ